MGTLVSEKNSGSALQYPTSVGLVLRAAAECVKQHHCWSCAMCSRCKSMCAVPRGLPSEEAMSQEMWSCDYWLIFIVCRILTLTSEYCKISSNWKKKSLFCETRGA